PVGAVVGPNACVPSLPLGGRRVMNSPKTSGNKPNRPASKNVTLPAKVATSGSVKSVIPVSTCQYHPDIVAIPAAPPSGNKVPSHRQPLLCRVSGRASKAAKRNGAHAMANPREQTLTITATNHNCASRSSEDIQKKLPATSTMPANINSRGPTRAYMLAATGDITAGRIPSGATSTAASTGDALNACCTESAIRLIPPNIPPASAINTTSESTKMGNSKGLKPRNARWDRPCCSWRIINILSAISPIITTGGTQRL